MTTPGRPDLDTDPPFLDAAPPHWAARSLSTLLIAFFTVAGIAMAVVTVPETVRGVFVLVPERGTDPVRTPREGTVAEVRAAEGQSVAAGATLFVIRSQSVGDRAAELRAVELQAGAVRERLANARAEHESQARADALERARLTTRIASLERVATLRRRQLDATREMAERSRRGSQTGAVSAFEADRLALEVDRLAADVEATEGERDEARAALARLAQDAQTREVRLRELARALQQEGEVAGARLAALRRDPAAPQGDLVVAAPCAGALLRLMVSTPGAVVQAGDALGEIACAGERLQVEMTLGQQDVARVRAGQGARLLYDAYPYQRYGTRMGRVRWVGPATAGRSAVVAPGMATAGDAGAADAAAFRALIDVDSATITVRGEARPLLAGMRGEARVVTGRRSLISHAFEPIRAMRENLSGAPEGMPEAAPATRGPAS